MEYEQQYPRVEINMSKLRRNIENMIACCRESGIGITGVIKGFNGLPQVAELHRAAGCGYLASSRLEQIKDCIEYGIPGPYMMIRIPMVTEIPALVVLADCSLHSERKVLEALNRECVKQDKKHEVLLMADLGDLREGFWDKQEMVRTAEYVEKELDRLHLLGVGTNLGCYGSIKATPENMNELIRIAEEIEEKIGRRLEIISGGASTSYWLVEKKRMPERINNLRIGGAMLIPSNLKQNFECKMEGCYEDVFTLKAEVIEVKDKPSFPVGERANDCFGNQCQYVDRGMRRRALLGVGKLDVCFPDKLFPRLSGIEILGGSSDHLLLDIEDNRDNIEVGDIMEFDMTYGAMLFLTSSRSVDLICV